jgi:hypothetical protein
MVISCVGFDSRYSTEYSNVDFFHFVWANTGILGFRRHALAFLPDPSTGHGDVLASPGRLVYLRHYRVASEGWMVTSRCDRCTATFRENLRPYMDCVAPEEPCNCNVYVRQPPTLRDIASRTLFFLSLHPEHFELKCEVTHNELVHAIDSERARVDRCLPPGVPTLTLHFTYEYCSHLPFHPHCNPTLPWHATVSRTFASPEEAFSALY